MRRLVGLFLICLLVAVAACTPRPSIENTEDGFVDPALWRDRQLAYLRRNTGTLNPGSPESVMAHLMRDDADPSFEVDATGISVADWQPVFDKIDANRDTSDFDLMRLWVIWHDHRAQLDPALADAMQQRLLGFRYWYTDPQPARGPDDKWFWSENHLMIIHTMEYLAGRDLTGQRFGVTGWTGDQHADRGRRFVLQWLDEKARYGMSEWHSDVYYPEDIQPLLLLSTYAEPDVAMRADALLDVLFLDLGLHQLDANNGVTHGRTYMKDKSRAVDQNVYNAIEFLFGDGQYTGWPDFTTLLLAGTDGYRMPVVLDHVARSQTTFTDIERMSVPLDPAAEVVDDPAPPPGVSFTDVADVPFWWSRGAMASWQVAPLTLRAVREYNLTSTDLFAPYGQITRLGATPAATQHLARALQCQLNPGLLAQVDTVTYRSPSVMLSSAQDYRAGCLAYQIHPWQATLGTDAVVFTTHPQNPDRGEWADDDRYWNGSASLPRVAQSDTTLIAVYAPRYPNGEDGQNYLPMTHAFFPQQHFDEIVERDGWTIGRRGDGFVALWSWRAPVWAPPGQNPAGLDQPYDLTAQGGADNVWITEVGDTTTYADFEDFVAKVTATRPQVVRTTQGTDQEADFAVAYDSPTQGHLEWGTAPAEFTINGATRTVPGARMQNPFVTVQSGTDVWHIAEGGASLDVDLTTGRRTAASN